ncbi:MAG: peptide chain release factor N(5)-glutamine methyltransferase [Bacteroidota bacterium]
MKIGEIQQELITSLLSIHNEGEAGTICDWVLEYHTGRNRMQRMIDKETQLPSETITAILLCKDQLLQHRPVQYVLGEAWFMGLKFFVNEAVLIPRPETEELVALLLDSCKLNSDEGLMSFILDIGTGSGCIPIALKKQLPGADIVSVDVCNEALQTAIKNASANQVSVNFLHMNFLDENKWDSLPVFDTIISNPPYIPLSEKATLDKHVIAWEPGTALFVPDNDPLLFYKKIGIFGKTHLAAGGKIFVETHQDYAVAAQQMFEENSYATELKKDINGNDRMITAWVA